MVEINVQFQEKYKQLDALCKDVFSSKEGVSVYINEMERTNFQFRRYIVDWEIVYKQLKHLRWIRNQLAHEVGAFDSDICTEFDLEWLTDFYNSILNRTDPLAIVGQKERELQGQRNIKEQQNYSNVDDNSKISLWSRIKAKFKSWFL